MAAPFGTADLTLDLEQHVDIKAAIADVFRGLVYRFSEGNVNPKGEPMPMILEAWPGGRWFRDLGSGAGHLWAHVQAIKSPLLLELSGPLFMSYPALNHVEIRLNEVAGETRVALRHRALGSIDPAHRDSVGSGWRHYLELVAGDFNASQ